MKIRTYMLTTIFWDWRRHDKNQKSKFIGKIDPIPIIESVTQINVQIHGNIL